MEHNIHVSHFKIELKSKFRDFTRRLENALGKLERSVLEKLQDNPANTEAEFQDMGGLENLILFGIEDHGKLLSITGFPGKARLYELGNPLIAAEITSIDIRAGLYHPLRLLVYVGDDNGTYAEYDLPSTLFGQFSKNSITQVGEMLDTKMQNLIRTIDLNEKYREADQIY